MSVAGDVREQPGALASRQTPRFPAPRHRILGVGVTHGTETEQAGDRCQAVVQRGRRISIGAPAVHANHVRSRPPWKRRLPARGEESQEHIGGDRFEFDVLA